MGVQPEDVELLRRKTEAWGIELIGLLIMFPGSLFFGVIVGLALSYQQYMWPFGYVTTANHGAGILVGLFVATAGGIITWYGDYLAKKYTHILWTKQALREYEEEKLRVTGAIERMKTRGMQKTTAGYPGFFETVRNEGVFNILSLGLNALLKKREDIRPSPPPNVSVQPIEYELVQEDEQKGKNHEKEEIQRYLDLLDKQLVEGKISEDTYKQLHQKYEQRLKEISSI